MQPLHARPKQLEELLPVPGALPVLLMPRDSVFEREARCIHARPQPIVVVVARDAPAVGMSCCHWYR